MSSRVVVGDCIAGMAELDPDSVDAIVCDPPYGLEFMGKAWDSFRLDDPGTNRNRGERAGSFAGVLEADPNDAFGGRIRGGAGGGKRPTTHRCAGCGKRDQYRNPHEPCGPGDWRLEVIDPHAAPPTMLAFQEWSRTWGLEAKRVLKPGGHLLAFGGTRTYHRLTSGLEDAGFEIRDCLVWLYGQGFPKSLDVGKAIDKRGGELADFATFRDAVRSAMAANGVTRAELSAALGNFMAGHYLTAGSQPAVPNLRDYRIIRDLVGLGDRFDELFLEAAEREKIGERDGTLFTLAPGEARDRPPVTLDVTAPATDRAQTWAGWGTALKPGHEPVVIARKPLAGTVLANVQAHGTGAMNIAAGTIGDEPLAAHGGGRKGNRIYGMGDGLPAQEAGDNPRAGRWPANVALDEQAALELDAQAPNVGGGRFTTDGEAGYTGGNVFGGGFRGARTIGSTPLDRGGASRFFYTAKASTAERDAGLNGEVVETHRYGAGVGNPGGGPTGGALGRNPHPTVKPVALMRWLVKMVARPAMPDAGFPGCDQPALVLDPFTGSGTTGIACALEGFRFLGFEQDAGNAAIAEARIRWWAEHGEAALKIVADRERADRERAELEAAGQLDLFAALAEGS